MRNLLLVLTVTLAVYAQQKQGEVRFQIRLEGKARPAPPPEPEAGDSVEIDPVSGAIAATSRGRSFTFPKHNFMRPVLQVSYSAAFDDVEYTYTLANAAGSANTISAFAIYLLEPAAAQATLPSPWRAIPILKPAPPETASLLLLPFGEDGTDRGQLFPGRQAGPFRIKAPGLPGLVRVVFSPERAIPKPGEVTEGDFFDWASAWVRERLLQLDTHDRHEIRGWTIGPRNRATANDLAAIQDEVREAAQVPEFAAASVEILAIASLSDPTAIRSRIARLPASSFQKQWAQAVLWKLDRLR